MRRPLLAALAFGSLVSTPAVEGGLAQTAPAQPPAEANPATATAATPILLTVFLKHDQSKNLTEINEQLFRNGYYDKFPPPGSRWCPGTS